MYNQFIDTKALNLSDMEDSIREAKLKLYRQFSYDYLINQKDRSLITKGLGVYEKPFIKWLNIKKQYRSSYKYILFTINFYEGIEMDLVFKKIHKALKKVWILSYMWCMEWRDLDRGMHCHIRCHIRPGKKAYDCKREMYSTFKDCVGNVQHVNYRASNIEDAFIPYIKGLKNGKNKDTHVLDTKMRKKYNLKDVYTS